MRNLKKLLSVVLVVAMIAGLCAVGSFSAAAAEYSEVTNYKEAAAVITGVGVMDGYEDGTMQYDKTVTREEAAAIICRALIGVDTAKKLSTAVAPFADVAANRWSAPYINYLKSQGIVNGKTATQFDPTAEVTAVEFAKMMLCAVGYGKAGEFVGASWDVNTITAANNNGVYTGTLAADLTAPATREQCMLYAFNTMTRVPVVNYNTAFQSYYVGTSVVSGIPTRVDDLDIGNSGASNVPGAGVNDNGYPYTLAYRNFKLESTDIGNDDFGRPAVKWTSNGKAIAESVSNKTPNYVLYGVVNSDVLYKTLGKAVVNDINNKTTADYNGFGVGTRYDLLTVYTNGVRAPLASFAAGMFTTGDIKSGETFVNNISGAGDTVELYVTEQNGVYAVKAVVINQLFAKVTKVDTAANKLYATVILGDANANTTTELSNCVADGDEVNINGLKKDDYILVNVHNNSNALANGSVITAIATPKTAVGTYNGTTFMGLFKDIDGNSVSTNKTIKTNLDWTIGNQYTFWYDSLGNVIYSEFYDAGEAAGTSTYFYVTKAEADAGNSILSGTDATLALHVVYTNGGEDVVKVLVNKDSVGKYFTITNPNDSTLTTKYYFTNATTLTPVDTNTNTTETPINYTSGNNIAQFNNFYAFTKTSDGFVKLSIPNATYAKADNTGSTTAYNVKTGTNTVTGISGFTATSSTVLTIIDPNGNVSSYTGFNNFPANLPAITSPDVYKVLYTYAANSTKLKSVTFYSNTPVAGASNLALCGGFWSETSSGLNVFFFVDGEYKMITFDKSQPSSYYAANKIYELTLSDSGNSATEVTTYWTGTQTDNQVDEGAVNVPAPYNYATATSLKTNNTAYLGLGNFNGAKFAIDEYYAWALIDDVDANIFTTKAVKADDVRNNPIYIHNTEIKASTYYFDSKTKIYDCRNNTCTKLTELPTNVAFVAYINDGLYTVKDVPYCEYIWIVG